MREHESHALPGFRDDARAWRAVLSAGLAARLRRPDPSQEQGGADERRRVERDGQGRAERLDQEASDARAPELRQRFADLDLAVALDELVRRRIVGR